MKKLFIVSFCSLLFVTGSCCVSWSSPAIITEVKTGQGAVEIRHPGEKEWRPVQPLLSLNSGDIIRASKDAYTVIIYSVAGGIVKVGSGNSPYEVISQKAGDSKAQKVQAALSGIAGFLAGRKRNMLSAPMAVRSLLRPPAIISPRDTKTLNTQPSFEWLGTPRALYAIRLMQADVLVWEKSRIYKTRIMYPMEEKSLSSGIRYHWEIETPGYPPVKAWFEIATEAEKQKLSDELSFLDGPDYKNTTKSTVAVLKYGALSARGYHADARNVLSDALSTEPDEPVLHILMGDYYDRVGLKDLAIEEYDEANFLMYIKQ